MTITSLQPSICKIPYLLDDYEISYEGILYLNGEVIQLSDFNDNLNLDVKNIQVLQLVTFHRFRWPPRYWPKLHAISLIASQSTPENMLLAIHEPVESLEFIGFYMIPYYSNYVISKDGVLIKRSDGRVMEASLALTGYYTFRMTGDNDKTGNVLRHRMLSMAFKEYHTDPELLTVNHINGVRGYDPLDNLEWCTLAENIQHAIDVGLYDHVKEVEVRDVNTGRIYIYPSQVSISKALHIAPSTLGRYVRSNGHLVLNGLQFRFFPCRDPWPEVESTGGFLITFPSGVTKSCCSKEAAKLCGVTRTSLMRLLREGRNTGANENIVTRL